MTFLTNLKLEPKGAHSTSQAYSVTDVVTSTDGSTAYVAVKDVPSGTKLSDTAYWVKLLDLSAVRTAAVEAASVADAAADNANAAANSGVRTDAAQDLNATQKDNVHGNIGLKEIVRSLTDGFEVSGNPAQCRPVGGLAFDGVETQFAPKQAGNGDPSPTNILPISGWEELKLMHAGENLFDNATFVTGGITAGTGVGTGEASRAKNDFLYLEAGTYTVATIGGVYPGRVHYYSEANQETWTGSYLLSDKLSGDNCRSTEFTIDTPCWVRIVFVPDQYDGTVSALNMLLASNPILHSTAAAYAVQIGETVYGGRMNWLTGELAVEWICADVSKLTWSYNATYGFAYCADFDRTVDGEVICSHYLNAGKTTNASASNYDKAVSTYYNDPHIRVRDSSYASLEEYTAFFAAQTAAGTPVQIAYQLAEPTIIQLTAQRIAAIQGVNTLYGDGNTLHVEGRTRIDDSIKHTADDEFRNVFLEMMAEKCATLGITDATWETPSGLGHNSISAASLAKIGAYACAVEPFSLVYGAINKDIHKVGIAEPNTLNRQSNVDAFADSAYTPLGWKSGGVTYDDVMSISLVMAAEDENGIYVGAIMFKSTDIIYDDRFETMIAFLDVATGRKNASELTTSQKNVCACILKLPAVPAMRASAGYEMLYAQNETTLNNPASASKVLTCITALDYIGLGEYITIKDHDLEGGTGANLFAAGDRLTVRDLMYAAIMPSANTAACALARWAGRACVKLKQAD